MNSPKKNPELISDLVLAPPFTLRCISDTSLLNKLALVARTIKAVQVVVPTVNHSGNGSPSLIFIHALVEKNPSTSAIHTRPPLCGVQVVSVTGGHSVHGNIAGVHRQWFDSGGKMVSVAMV